MIFKLAKKTWIWYWTIYDDSGKGLNIPQTFGRFFATLSIPVKYSCSSFSITWEPCSSLRYKVLQYSKFYEQRAQEKTIILSLLFGYLNLFSIAVVLPTGSSFTNSGGHTQSKKKERKLRDICRVWSQRTQGKKISFKNHALCLVHIIIIYAQRSLKIENFRLWSTRCG